MSDEFKQNLAVINFLLAQPTTTAIGAYALGVVSCLAERDGVIAPDVLLETAVACESIAQAVDLYKASAALRD